jgi:hypothetical protein
MTADEPDRLTLRLEEDLSLVASLPDDERTRLIIRVLCELVAYDATPVTGPAVTPARSR